MKNIAAQMVSEEKLNKLSAEKRELLEALFRRKDLPANLKDEVRILSEAETRLKHIWEQVLKIPAIGVDDNFFELGGDSIQCIQIVSRARRENLHFSTAQMFENPTIARLAEIADQTRPNVEKGEQLFDGEIALLPTQDWFFSLDLKNPHHWNQAVMLKTKSVARVSAIECAWQIVLERHEALRFRYEKTEGHWIQKFDGGSPKLLFKYADLSKLDRDSGTTEMARQIDLLQAGLDLGSGNLLKIALFDFGETGGMRMLITAHHLVVDGFSFRIMLEDFQTAYRQIVGGREISLPAKTVSFARWTREVGKYSKSAELANELEFWNKIAASETVLPPRDFENGENTEASAGVFNVACDEYETCTLLQKTLQKFRARINDVLLCALADALSQWTKGVEFLVHVEGHGREEIAAGLDLSRTVGWFTSIFPALIRLPEDGDQVGKLNAVKRQLADIPKRGIGYGILRHAADEEVRRKLLPLKNSEIIFNYLGQFDGVLETDQPFSPSSESVGRLYGADNGRSFSIRIVCRIVEGRFSADFHYSRNLHRSETIQFLAESFVESLRKFIRESEKLPRETLSVADFPHSSLQKTDFDRLTASFDRSESSNVEDIYDLTPIQRGLLFHSIAEPESGMYLEQGVCDLRGNLNLNNFRAAWDEIQRRHPVLRTAFFWKDLSEPQQIVFRRGELPLFINDWRETPAEKQEAMFEDFIRADRIQGVDFTKAPLLRLNLFRMADEHWKFVLTIHHLINDSWSTNSMLREFFDCYQETPAAPKAVAPPFVSYVEWLKNQDAAAAEKIWREQMRGFASPTPILKGWQPAADSTGKGQYERAETVFSAAETNEISRFAAKHQLTVNTIFQAAWGIYLFATSEKPDIVFGGVVSGRPADLENGEDLVGVLINTLPIRFKYDSETKNSTWLQTIQKKQSRLRQYEYLPLKTIQKFSEVPPEKPLFESVLVFQNASGDFERMKIGDLQIENVRHLGFPHYPLTVRVWLSEKFILETLFNRDLIAEQRSREILEIVKNIVLQIVAAPDEELQHAVKFAKKKQKEQLQNKIGERRASFSKARLKGRNDY